MPKASSSNNASDVSKFTPPSVAVCDKTTIRTLNGLGCRRGYEAHLQPCAVPVGNRLPAIKQEYLGRVDEITRVGV